MRRNDEATAQSALLSIWRTLWPVTDGRLLFWGETNGVSWVAHFSPVSSGHGYRYTLVIDEQGWYLHTFDQLPSDEDVRAMVAAWFRLEAMQRREPDADSDGAE